jgi:GT2 family glycosyltransferase
MPDLSVVIVNWNAGGLLRQCVASVQANAGTLNVEILVVDNHSTDGSIDGLERDFPLLQVLSNDRNVGFAAANNQAIRRAHGRHVLLLNPDTVVLPGALETMVKFMETCPQAVALGCRLLNGNMTLQYSCAHFPNLLNMTMENLGLSRLLPRNPAFARGRMTWWDHDEVREVDQPSGACLLVRRSALEEVGLLDERFFMYFEEVDLCFRLKKHGWKIYFTPEAQVIHYGGQSSQWSIAVRATCFYHSMLSFFDKHYSRADACMIRAVVAVTMIGRVLVLSVRCLLGRSQTGHTAPLVRAHIEVIRKCLFGGRGRQLMYTGDHA